MRPPGRIYQRWPWVEHFDLPPGLCMFERRKLAPLRREIGVAGHYCSPFMQRVQFHICSVRNRHGDVQK